MSVSGWLRTVGDMTNPRRAGHRTSRPDPTRTATLHRDAALERGRTVTKGVAMASVAAVAAAGVYLSQALPGHASTPASSSGTTVPASGGASATPSSGYGDGSAQAPSAPAYVPAPVQNQAPVVSSGSS